MIGCQIAFLLDHSAHLQYTNMERSIVPVYKNLWEYVVGNTQMEFVSASPSPKKSSLIFAKKVNWNILAQHWLYQIRCRHCFYILIAGAGCQNTVARNADASIHTVRVSKSNYICRTVHGETFIRMASLRKGSWKKTTLGIRLVNSNHNSTDSHHHYANILFLLYSIYL